MNPLTLSDVHGHKVELSRRDGLLLLDIDGTVANLGHRLHHIKKSPKDWAAFHKGMADDKPIPHVIEAVLNLQEIGWLVVACTGRMESGRRTTEVWLAAQRIVPTALYMRPNDNYQPDTAVKSALIDRIEQDFMRRPDLAFEDRDRVVAMLRARNIPTLQVAFGDY